MNSIQFENLLEIGPWLLSLDLIVVIAPLLLAAGTMGISFCTSWAGGVGGKVFADKLAKQLSEFSVIVLGLWLLLVSARWGLWLADWWPAGTVGRGFYPLFFDLPGHLALAATLASIGLVRLWKRGRRATGGHLALGGVATVLWAAVLILFTVGSLWRLRDGQAAAKMIDGLAWPVLTDPLAWLVSGHALFTAAAMAAGLSLLYLLARRNAEDYGRDYYVWSIKRCAWWAVIAGIVQAGWAKAVFWREVLAGPDRSMLAGTDWINDTIVAVLGHAALPALALSLVLAVSAWLCLVPVLRSQTPLRMKGWVLLHAALVVAGSAAFSRMYVELLG